MNYIVAQLLGGRRCCTVPEGCLWPLPAGRGDPGPYGGITVQCLFHRRCHDFYSDYEHPNDQKPRDYQHCCFS